MIYYHDGSYVFSVFDLPFEIGNEPDRKSVEKALEAYSIVVPEAAEFVIEDDGGYTFTCDKYIDGTIMMDGSLRVRNKVTEHDTLLSIENHLVRYTYYKDIAIISPQEAYEELKDGKFAYAEALKCYAREAYSLLRQLEKTSGMKGLEKKREESRILAGAPMGDEEKKIIVGYLIGTEMVTESGNPSQYAKFLTATDRGLSIDSYMELRASGADVEDLLEATDAGMNAEAAAEFLISQANQTEDMDLSKVDRWRLSVDFSEDVTDQLALLSLVMTEAQLSQVELANKFKVDPRMYVDVCELLPKYDTDGNGKYKQSEIKEALDSTKLSREQKAVLWQVLASSTKSSKNNPYSQEIGQKILDARN